MSTLALSAPPVRWRRVHLVELEDLSWFPAVFRDAGTSFLELAVTMSGHAALLVPKLAEAVRRSGQRHLVDLCAGGGGPLAVVVDGLAKEGLDVTAVQTDLFPNVGAFRRISAANPGKIAGEERPVDATAVPADLKGLRVMFNAFHHFTPEGARAVLADTVRARQPIALFEVVSREPFSLFGLMFSPLFFLLSLPRLRPFRWVWLFWTFIIPVIPAFILWDGLVSWLRIYSQGELAELVGSLDAPGWTWDIGTIKLGAAPAHATYLVGYPPS